MNGSKGGARTTSSIPLMQEKTNVRTNSLTSPSAETLEMSGQASLNLTTVLPLGSVPAGLLSGEYDRAGHHTSLLNVSSGQTGTREERTSSVKSRVHGPINHAAGPKALWLGLESFFEERYPALADEGSADCGQCGRDAASCTCDFGV
jgi:hypothetical protein